MKRALILLAVLALAGPSLAADGFTPAMNAVLARQLPKARTALDESLNDYTTARFRDVRAIYNAEIDTVRFCGFINAKNLMGAYIGWRRFIVLTGRTASASVYTEDNDQLQMLLICDNQSSNDTVDTRDHSANLAYRP